MGRAVARQGRQAISAAFQSRFGCGGARGHDPDYSGPVDTVYLGCWRREIFDRIGLFDEELVRNQDDEFNLRLVRSGGKVWQSVKIKSWYTRAKACVIYSPICAVRLLESAHPKKTSAAGIVASFGSGRLRSYAWRSAGLSLVLADCVLDLGCSTWVVCRPVNVSLSALTASASGPELVSASSICFLRYFTSLMVGVF